MRTLALPLALLCGLTWSLTQLVFFFFLFFAATPNCYYYFELISVKICRMRYILLGPIDRVGLTD